MVRAGRSLSGMAHSQERMPVAWCTFTIFCTEERNAENEDKPWCSQEIQGHGFRENRQEQGFFQPYPDKKDHKAEKKASEILSGGFRKHEACDEASSVSLTA